MSWIKQKLAIIYRKIGVAILNYRGRRQLNKRGYLSLFDARPATAKPPVWSDLWAIYSQVRARKPKVLLEFGSGCSTIIFAQALADNAAEGAPGFLHSLDADAHWGQVTIDSLPEHLRLYCTVTLTERVQDELDGTPVWRFAKVPDVVADMIYLDGPALTPERRAAIDVLDMEADFPPGFRLLVDGRSFNRALLEKYFKRRYQRQHRPILKSTTYDLLPD
ncbi:MAG: hypothetical protein HOA08_10480 [Rhodospirillaceae bacterium]|jgi:hypothetical protein|nr:hypothetical protein [Rhodospirillaceae bacterium]MBT3494316.1 hypothetical protein [Rhodospirillaceae bacterium]MBT3780420.1 hypothetical protein [Rhodospirillaceae bacterium]MBT3979143.1 hypothetical protein [Rhodospirillaceae bacterium]MBT4170271.1 hypothetical protein [Rhodospirillaceae bacterium]